MALTMRQRKAIKRFIVHLASGTPADGGPLACRWRAVGLRLDNWRRTSYTIDRKCSRWGNMTALDNVCCRSVGLYLKTAVAIDACAEKALMTDVPHQKCEGHRAEVGLERR